MHFRSEEVAEGEGRRLLGADGGASARAAARGGRAAARTLEGREGRESPGRVDRGGAERAARGPQRRQCCLFTARALGQN